MTDREAFREARDAGLKKRHKQRLARALMRIPTHTIDGEQLAEWEREFFAQQTITEEEARMELRDQIAKALDPKAFDDTVPKSTRNAAVLQWAVRRKMAYDSADVLLRPIAEAVDLCWKATPYGTTKDGDVHTYLVPKGVVHRLVGALQGVGISASLRALTTPPDTEEQQ